MPCEVRSSGAEVFDQCEPIESAGNRSRRSSGSTRFMAAIQLVISPARPMRWLPHAPEADRLPLPDRALAEGRMHAIPKPPPTHDVPEP